MGMKRIFSSSNSAEVGLLASRLENAGIPCEVRNEALAQVIPGIAFEPELWILNDEDYAEATALLASQPEAGALEALSTGQQDLPDVSSIQSIVAGFYQTISGPADAGQARERLRNLFYPGARLLRTVVSPEGTVNLSAMGVEDFVNFAAPLFGNHAFYERELFSKIDQFGHIAHVFSTFESFSTPDGSNTSGRGINSIQLWSDGNRWWVMSMLWDDERTGNQIPKGYLP
jgi:hypothetical protein